MVLKVADPPGKVIMTLATKLTMAVAGCSGSSSAKMWHWLSVLEAALRATKPKHRLHNKILKFLAFFY